MRVLTLERFMEVWETVWQNQPSVVGGCRRPWEPWEERILVALTALVLTVLMNVVMILMVMAMDVMMTSFSCSIASSSIASETEYFQAEGPRRQA